MQLIEFHIFHTINHLERIQRIKMQLLVVALVVALII